MLSHLRGMRWIVISPTGQNGGPAPQVSGRASPRFDPCHLIGGLDPWPSHQTSFGRSAINVAGGLRLPGAGGLRASRRCPSHAASASRVAQAPQHLLSAPGPDPNVAQRRRPVAKTAALKSHQFPSLDTRSLPFRCPAFQPVEQPKPRSAICAGQKTAMSTLNRH